ncbi:MAG: 30S ribosomal protein S4 [bacterium]|nr:30S ribosomal protein S4 [bacterium]
MPKEAIVPNKCRYCRREGVKLFSKGARCNSPRCPIERKGAVAPGVAARTTTHRRRTRVSDYARQLKEKQKLRNYYSIEEKQLKHYFKRAKLKRGETAEILIQILESRLDNLVFRLGFVTSRRAARQLISHGHITVNGSKVDISSYLVKKGEIIGLSTKGLKIPIVEISLKESKDSVPEWLERKAAIGMLKRLPEREEIRDIDVNDQMVVEYYSK